MRTSAVSARSRSSSQVYREPASRCATSKYKSTASRARAWQSSQMACAPHGSSPAPTTAARPTGERGNIGGEGRHHGLQPLDLAHADEGISRVNSTSAKPSAACSTALRVSSEGPTSRISTCAVAASAITLGAWPPSIRPMFKVLGPTPSTWVGPGSGAAPGPAPACAPRYRPTPDRRNGPWCHGP